MLRTLKGRNVVRSSPRITGTEFSGCRYRDAYTLDPEFAQEAWDTLSEDTFPVEVATYPALFHRAFIGELKKRGKHA